MKGKLIGGVIYGEFPSSVFICTSESPTSSPNGYRLLSIRGQKTSVMCLKYTLTHALVMSYVRLDAIWLERGPISQHAVINCFLKPRMTPDAIIL